MTSAPLITPTELQDRLGEGRLRIVDATVHLTFDADGAHVASGRDTYLEGHLPGAVFIDQITGLSDPDGEAPFAAASSEKFAATVGEAGIGDHSTVVVYDTVNGIWATRLWWQFGLEGFDDVVVLDGGYDAWVKAGLPTETGESPHPAATFTAHRRPGRIASTDEVVAATADSSVLLVNALDRESFSGGHIPSSVNVPFGELVDESGALKSLDELRELFTEAGALDPAVRPVTYCGGGIAATAAALALKTLGRHDVAVYDGSMNASTADPARPLSSVDSRS
ncbi:sulfurtransferase [Gordonia westfalica]|uniref:Thiosulfate/3-mercaptopyruvate sulfurtransferase n=1 Tax=Gordonia westfalica TaxID=158898 RepID=A0A1H2HRW9_9ACTN|nr:sulfurtransferase [Gordonia westfalica]SDU34663.1 thiosulfate/3-mercaptopyruvate sulfurtransferase [Gordonia westfalica]